MLLRWITVKQLRNSFTGKAQAKYIHIIHKIWNLGTISCAFYTYVLVVIRMIKIMKIYKVREEDYCLSSVWLNGLEDFPLNYINTATLAIYKTQNLEILHPSNESRKMWGGVLSGVPPNIYTMVAIHPIWKVCHTHKHTPIRTHTGALLGTKLSL